MSANPVGAVGDVLKREVGGLPVIAWAGIVGGGIVVGRRLAGGGLFGGGRTPAPEVTPFIDPNVTGYTATGEPASSGQLGGSGSKPTTNAQWRAAAVDFLVSVGTNPIAAELAVTRYLSGEALTGTEPAIISTAVRQLGAPPEGVPLPPAPPPSSNPTGAARSPRSTTVKAPYGLGENLNQVATRIRRPLLLGGEGVTTTPTGAPLTAAYLANVNGLSVSFTRALKPGTRIVY